MSTSRLAEVADEIADEDSDNYSPNASKNSVGSDYDEDDFDADAGASALLNRAGKPSSPNSRRTNSSATKVNDASNRLVAAAQGSTDLWAQLYGSAYQKQQYYPAVVLRKNRDNTYNVKFKNGERNVGISLKSFKLERDDREDKKFALEAGDRVLCKKKSGPSKSRMNEMSVPTCLRKPKPGRSNRKFSSDEDASECTFTPKLKKKDKGKDGESKTDDADFLIRMEAKENSRRVELERRRFEAKRKEQKRKKGAKKWTDEDGEKFLNRLAKAEEKKKKRYSQLQKEQTPSFNVTERKVFDETTGKIITVPVEKAKPDVAAFFARLESDALKKQERAKARNLNNTSPVRRSKSSMQSDSIDEFSNTMY